MENFGCVYSNIGGGICMKIRDISNISKKCTIENNNCVIKSPNISNNIEISGPVLISIGNYNNKRYYFFGDRHGSIRHVCPEPCSNFNNCYDITQLISDMSRYDDSIIDFYIEHPFLGKSMKIKPSNEYFSEDELNVGYLHKIASTFWPCIQKEISCIYPNIRFHYIDIRYTFELNDYSWQPKIMTMDNYIITERLGNCYKRLLYIGNKNEKDLYIEDTNSLFQYFYDSNGRIKKLFTIILSSRNYESDVKKLISKLHITENKTVYEIINILFNTDYIVNRDGNNLHRIGAQLYELQQDGEDELSKNIMDFMNTEYEINPNILEQWNYIYNLYLNRMTKYYYNDILNIDKGMILNLDIKNTSLLTDAYTLARMFRKFNDKDHEDSKRVIIFAGYQHIKRYHRFFVEYLNVEFIDIPNDVFDNKKLIINRCHKVPENLFFY